MRKKQVASLLTVLLAFGARMIRIQSRPLWYDEAFAILYARLSPARMIYGTITPAQGAAAADVHPLLYYFSLHGWLELVGPSPLAARFLSVVFGMLTLALLWRLVAWTFDRRTGLIVGLLVATNPFHVAYSQEARMYSLLGLTAVTATYGLLRAVRPDRAGSTIPDSACQWKNDHRLSARRAVVLVDRWKWWGLYAVGAALTVYTHNLGAFTLLALHVLVIAHRMWWHHLPVLALADLIVLALFGPWLIAVLPGQVGFVRGGYWLSSPGANQVVRALMLPVLTLYEPTPMWLLGLGLFVSLTILALLVLHAVRTHSRARWFLLLCWLPILLLFLIACWWPVYLERALLPSALFYLVAIGWFLAGGRLPNPLVQAVAVLLAVTTVGSLGTHYAYEGFPRPPFQQAVEFLQARVEAGDAVVHTNKLTYFPMHAYDSDLPADFLADPPGSPQDTLAYPTQEALGIFATPTITEAVGTAGRIWLVYFPRELREARALAGGHPALDWVENRFVELEQEQFAHLVIALYRRELSKQ